VAVAYHRGDSGEPGNFLGRALCIAAGDDNARLRIDAVGPPNECTCRPICLGRYAARVDDDHIGFRGLLLAVAGGAQPAADRFAIRAGGPATEMFHMKARH